MASNFTNNDKRKNIMFTVRLDSDQSQKLKELAEHVEASTGIKVTHAWILRELLTMGYDQIKEKYKIKVAI